MSAIRRLHLPFQFAYFDLGMLMLYQKKKITETQEQSMNY